MSYSLPCGLRRADIRGIAAAVSPATYRRDIQQQTGRHPESAPTHFNEGNHARQRVPLTSAITVR